MPEVLRLGRLFGTLRLAHRALKLLLTRLGEHLTKIIKVLKWVQLWVQRSRMAPARSSSCKTFPHPLRGLFVVKTLGRFPQMALVNHMEQHVSSIGTVG